MVIFSRISVYVEIQVKVNVQQDLKNQHILKVECFDNLH